MDITLVQPKPFSGAPVFHMPVRLGFSTGKPALYRVPVTGERPIALSCTSLPEGLELANGILTGVPARDEAIQTVFTARNAAGEASFRVSFTIAPDTRLLTPLTGFTTWNAFASEVTQEDVSRTAGLMVETGLADYGYGYVNVDSGWQSSPLAPDGGIEPNEKFPDMAAMCAGIHEKGLKTGIYSTPMLNAWGCPKEYPSIPGCTSGEPDRRFTSKNGGIGIIHNEEVNVARWEKWGFDYLKYDWIPADTVNADRMKQALLRSKRDFAFSVTVHAMPEFREYWRENVNSYRHNPDSTDEWPRVLEIFSSVDGWEDAIRPGHFFDMDMLETGWCGLWGHACRLSEEEQLFAFSMRALFASPLQISCELEKMTDFERAMYCNEEVLAVHRDALAAPARKEEWGEGVILARRPLSDGGEVLGFFHTGEKVQTLSIPVPADKEVRDLWQGRTLKVADDLTVVLPAHAARLYRVF